MIKRFIKINNALYRGGAPTPEDVRELSKNYGIKKIVSLDKDAGKRIDRICKLLNITHITIPIDMTHLGPLFELVNLDLHNLLIEGGPTFVHCQEGKDRTGMVCAMYKCKYLNWSCDRALTEAKKLGFGHGLDPKVVKLFEKIVCMNCQDEHDHCNSLHIDKNNADITGNSREEAQVYLDEANMKSLAPYMDADTRYIYDYKYDQFPNRENTWQNDPSTYNDKTESTGTDMPQVGTYDNDAGIGGSGPVENGGGFVNV